MFSFLRQSSKPPASVLVDLDGRPVEITVRVSKRARSFRLSLPASGPVLSLPEKARWADAEAFLMRHRNWLAARLPRVTRSKSLAAGAEVPLRGEPLASPMQAAAQRLSRQLRRRDGGHQRNDGAVLNSNACCEQPPGLPEP